MRLKDKQTGKVGDYAIVNRVGKHCVGVAKDGDIDNPIFFDSIAELNERFEDAPEEIKPFEDVATEKYRCAAPWDYDKPIVVADIDYYEILPDGTKKTEFTWDEAMEIEKETHGKWRVPTVTEWFAICAAFGRSEDGTDVDPQILKDNLGLVTDEGGYGSYWSAATYNSHYSRNLDFGASYLLPRNGDNKGNGFAVRCVAAQ